MESTFAEFLLTAIGAVAYTLVVVVFYKSLHRRDVFVDWSQKQLAKRRQNEVVRTLAYVGGVVIVVPLILITFATIFFLFLLAATKNRSVEDIAAISAGIIVAVRILAYIWEEPAHELAKLLPLTLLALALFEGRGIDFDLFEQRLDELDESDTELFVGYIIVVEWSMRTILVTVQTITRRVKDEALMPLLRTPLDIEQ